ncbi:hypothetical protein [Tardiphaga sp.]|uniref:hypothetical protein n=1 Tax=Tardiphaga sp. TaxID=1926292 RepID=UPI00352A3CAD
MDRKPIARPAKKPARAAVVSNAVPKATVAKKREAAAAKIRASVDARKKTIAATCAKQRAAVDRLHDLPPDAPLTVRVTRAIACELDSIERIVGRTRVNESLRTDVERRARTLASLARTLTELKKVQGGTDQRPAEDDDRPRDLDELRRRISERLARRLGDRQSVSLDGNDAQRERLPE